MIDRSLVTIVVASSAGCGIVQCKLKTIGCLQRNEPTQKLFWSLVLQVLILGLTAWQQEKYQHSYTSYFGGHLQGNVTSTLRCN